LSEFLRTSIKDNRKKLDLLFIYPVVSFQLLSAINRGTSQISSRRTQKMIFFIPTPASRDCQKSTTGFTLSPSFHLLLSKINLLKRNARKEHSFSRKSWNHFMISIVADFSW